MSVEDIVWRMTGALRRTQFEKADLSAKLLSFCAHGWC